MADILRQIKKSTFGVETAKEKVEQFFMPAYRYKEQLLDIYSKPENIMPDIFVRELPFSGDLVHLRG